VLAAACPRLCVLNLAHTAVESDLGALGGAAWPRLRWLDASSTRLWGNIDGLSGSERLVHLRLSRLKLVGGNLFPALAKMRRLRTLLLQGTDVGGNLEAMIVTPTSFSSSETAAPIAAATTPQRAILVNGRPQCSLPSLRRISLESCRNVTGSILPFAACPELCDVDVSFSNLTGGRALAFLAKACPHLRRVKAMLAPRFAFRLDKSTLALLPLLGRTSDTSGFIDDRRQWNEIQEELRRKQPGLQVITVLG
jgi:hypothetical protein